MSDEFERLENELHGMQPRAMSERTRRGIEEALAAPSAGRVIPFRKILFRVGAVAAAMVVITTIAIRLRAPGNPDAGAEPMQVAAPAPEYIERAQVDTLLLNSEDEGIIMVGDNQPARRVRVDLVDRMEWTNRASGRSMQMTRPRSEIVLVGLRTD